MKLRQRILALMLASVMALCMTACGGSAGTDTGTDAAAEEGQTEESTAAVPEDSSAEEAAGEEADGAGVDEILQQAVTNVEASTGAQSEWYGPKEGPAAAENRSIVVINANSANPSEAAWGEAVKTACDRIGWECTVLDGKGTTQGQIEAFSQAIAVGAGAIVTSADAESLQASIEDALDAGIPTVGIHSSATNGPDEDLNLYYNITTTGTQIGHALADYAIADSNGTGRVIILYDSQYAIAREKAEAMEERIRECSTMELLDVVNSPLAEISTNMPSLASSWISTYGTEEPIYVLSIADCYYDYIVTSLRSAGVSADDLILVGSDGDAAAYDRIRNGEYQAATIPESASLIGYIAVDQINRFFNEEDPYTFDMNVFIVTADNIESEGGNNNEFVPGNQFAEEYADIWGVE